MPSYKPFNKEMFENLLNIQCTKAEIAGIFDMTEECLKHKIKEFYGDDATFISVKRQKGQQGKMSLRRQQYKEAMKGNTTMLVWLGKNWLGQSDDPIVEDLTEDPYPSLFND